MIKQTAQEIKKKNKSDIYCLLWANDNLSRKEVGDRLQLSLPTVTQNIAELMEEGLIKETGFIGNTGGRRAKVYSVDKNARCAIGLDITRHHVTAVAVDLAGCVMHHIRIRYEFSLSIEYYKRLSMLVNEVIAVSGIDKQKILGVGIGLPGLVTEDKRNVFYGKILDFTGATCEEFSQFIPYPSAFCNDANGAGFAEIWANSNLENAFYLMLSNNVGGAIVINGQVYCGEGIRSGEVGHITIVPNGKPCYCGQFGCVDPYCAATNLSDLTDGNLESFFRQLEQGEPVAKKAWDDYLYYLSLTVNNLRMLFDCKIILGGYVGAYIAPYMGRLKEMAAARNTFESNADYLCPCRYTKEAIAAGAALPFIDDFIKSI